MTKEKQYLTTPEVAKLLGVSYDAVRYASLSRKQFSPRNNTAHAMLYPRAGSRNEDPFSQSPRRGSTMTSHLVPTMPFGKHKGKPLTKVPKGYIGWILDHFDLSDGLRRDLQAVLNRDPLPPRAEDLEATLRAIMRGKGKQ